MSGNQDPIDPRNPAMHTEELVVMVIIQMYHSDGEQGQASYVGLYMIALILSFHPNNQTKSHM